MAKPQISKEEKEGIINDDEKTKKKEVRYLLTDIDANVIYANEFNMSAGELTREAELIAIKEIRALRAAARARGEDLKKIVEASGLTPTWIDVREGEYNGILVVYLKHKMPKEFNTEGLLIEMMDILGWDCKTVFKKKKRAGYGKGHPWEVPRNEVNWGDRMKLRATKCWTVLSDYVPFKWLPKKSDDSEKKKEDPENKTDEVEEQTNDAEKETNNPADDASTLVENEMWIEV